MVEFIRVFVLLIGVLSYSVAMTFYFLGKSNIKNFSVGFWVGIAALTLTAPVILGYAQSF